MFAGLQYKSNKNIHTLAVEVHKIKKPKGYLISLLIFSVIQGLNPLHLE